MDVVVNFERPWPEMVSLFGIVVALLIAVGNWCWQSHLQNVTLRHDLFEKRFEIYRSLREFIHKLMSNGSVERPDVEALTKHAMAVEFLFRQEQIVSLLNEACHKALDLDMWDAKRIKRGPELSDSEKEKYQDTVMWFSTEANAQLKLFSPYLKLYRERHFFKRALMESRAIFKHRRSPAR